MELLKLSKFKLQLRALISEVRYLRERERSYTEQLHALAQKQKQNDEEYSKNLQELQAELATSNEMCQKAERKVNYLQEDNALLENRQKELKATIQSLLQSRDDFINAYEESTCEMRRAIEMRDRKLNVLSEKINSHLLLFDSIEKEAFSIKKAVDKVECLVSEKEGLVSNLRGKMEKVSSLEQVFIASKAEKIQSLESKLRSYEEDLKSKDRTIAELEAHLEVEKMTDDGQIQVEEHQRLLAAKDVIIESLLSEKKGLLIEVGNLSMMLLKIQKTVTEMNEEEKRKISSILEHQDACAAVTADINNGIKPRGDETQVIVENCTEDNFNKVTVGSLGSSSYQNHKLTVDLLRGRDHIASCISECASSPTPLACSGPQSAGHAPSVSGHDSKDSDNDLKDQVDSEMVDNSSRD